MPAKAKPKQKDDLVETFDVEQRSEEWYRLRCGIPTASRFGTIMASGKDEDGSATRREYLYVLAGEILTGKPTEKDFESRAMARGVAMEPAARAYYERTRGFVDLEPVGFVRRTIFNQLSDVPLVAGCSPDSYVGKSKVLEIKTTRPDLLIPLALKGAAGFPTGNRPQCQGNLWISGRDVCDLMFFYEGMPVAPTFTIERDDSYIRTIQDAVETFAYELRQLVERLRSMGPRIGESK